MDASVCPEKIQHSSVAEIPARWYSSFSARFAFGRPRLNHPIESYQSWHLQRICLARSTKVTVGRRQVRLLVDKRRGRVTLPDVVD